MKVIKDKRSVLGVCILLTTRYFTEVSNVVNTVYFQYV